MALTVIKTDINISDEHQDDYTMSVRNVSDVLDMLRSDNLPEDEIFITKAIISNLEEAVANGLRDNLIVNIPNVGTIYRNPAQHEMVLHRKELALARKSMSKDEYVDYAKSLASSAKLKFQKEQYRKKVYNSIKTYNKKKYELLYANCGKAYANLWIESLLMMEVVPYNEELEEAFINLNNSTYNDEY